MCYYKYVENQYLTFIPSFSKRSGASIHSKVYFLVALTQRLHRWYLAPEKGEPEVELPLLLDAAVGQVEEDHVLAVDVADEVVVEDVVVGVAGELPDAHLAHGALEAIV